MGGVLGFFYGWQLVVMGEKHDQCLRAFAGFVVFVDIAFAHRSIPGFLLKMVFGRSSTTLINGEFATFVIHDQFELILR